MQESWLLNLGDNFDKEKDICMVFSLVTKEKKNHSNYTLEKGGNTLTRLSKLTSPVRRGTDKRTCLQVCVLRWHDIIHAAFQPRMHNRSLIKMRNVLLIKNVLRLDSSKNVSVIKDRARLWILSRVNETQETGQLTEGPAPTLDLVLGEKGP